MFHGFIPHIMGTRFDMLIIHPDSSLSDKVWTTITGELEYLDKMLNRFDPESEVARLNALSPQEPVPVSTELGHILQLCQYYYEHTLQLFDVTLKDWSQIQFTGQSISFRLPSLSLDFGGFAKGYALKKIDEILEQNGLQDTFVDFGNSSISGRGHHPYGDCWKVSLSNPYANCLLQEFELRNNTLSTSGNTPHYTGHIIHPATGVYNDRQAVSAVMSPDPLDAEILSTVWMIADEQQREKINETFRNIQATLYSL